MPCRTHSESIGVGQQIGDVQSYVVILEMVHEMCAVAAHLLVFAHGTENDLGEVPKRKRNRYAFVRVSAGHVPVGKHAKTDAADDFRSEDDNQRLMPWIENGARDVRLGHFRQGTGEHIDQLEQSFVHEIGLVGAVFAQIVFDQVELSEASLFCESGDLVAFGIGLEEGLFDLCLQTLLVTFADARPNTADELATGRGC